jgi:polyhydroxybutyrate depolymerase
MRLGAPGRCCVAPARTPSIRLRAAVLGLLTACLACAPAPSVVAVTPVAVTPVAVTPVAVTPVAGTPVTRTVTLPSAAGQRTAVVHHPPAAGAGAPLVVVLHGLGGSGASMRDGTGWDGLAAREGFVVAYPDGLDRAWNAGACCGRSQTRGVDDVSVLDRLVAELRDTDGIGAVHAVGFSNGAEMAYAWACARPGTLAGIGAVGGALLVACPAPAPLTVVAVHGSADRRVPIDGGRGPSGATYPALDASLAPFRTAAGCPAEPVVADLPPSRIATWTCADGHEVVRAVVDGLGHAWPSGDPLDTTGFLWTHLRAAGT